MMTLQVLRALYFDSFYFVMFVIVDNTVIKSIMSIGMFVYRIILYNDDLYFYCCCIKPQILTNVTKATRHVFVWTMNAKQHVRTMLETISVTVRRDS